jgi:hypothetical protein
LKACLLGCRQIDGEADPVVLHQEKNHAAAVKKSRQGAHGQDGLPLDGSQVFGETRLFGLPNEKNLAAIRGGSRRQSPWNDFAALQGFIGDQVVEFFAERIFAESADGKRLRVLSGIGGPLNKLAELEKIGGFKIVWSEGGMTLWRAERRKAQENQGATGQAGEQAGERAEELAGAENPKIARSFGLEACVHDSFGLALALKSREAEE